MLPRILVIGNYNDVQASRPEAEIYISLRKEGYPIFIATDKECSYAKRFTEEGLEIIDYSAGKKFDKENIALLRGILTQYHIDIMHIFSPKAMVNAIQAAKNIPVKVIAYRGYTGNTEWWDLTLYYKHLSPRVDAITCLTDATRDLVRKNLLWNKEKAITIKKGHKTEWYENVEAANLDEFSIPKDAFVISCTANVRPMKGVKYLIQAMRYLSLNTPIHILLIGKGFDTGKFLKMIETSPLKSNIHLAGFRSDAMSLVKACNASILPSIYGEAITKAVIESMYMRVPAIITDISGNRGMVVNGKSGYIVARKNAKALASAMEMMASDKQHAKIMGDEAFKHISAFLSHDDTVEQIKLLYGVLMRK